MHINGVMTQAERRLWLIHYLKEEGGPLADAPVPPDADGQRRLLRGLMNVRPPEPVGPEFLAVQDAYLQTALCHKDVTDAAALPLTPDRLGLWRGDITTLRVDAIVNAANDALLGCFIPCHSCIDNAIHSASGVQLRLACHDLMKQQGAPEPTGAAKLTPGFNLPARYVVHTVGPIVHGPQPTREDREALAACYRVCLTRAVEHGLASLAFCCISTGVFHFPNEPAAEIAVRTVRDFLKNDHTLQRVIFNVFTERDETLYRLLLA